MVYIINIYIKLVGTIQLLLFSTVTKHIPPRCAKQTNDILFYTLMLKIKHLIVGLTTGFFDGNVELKVLTRLFLVHLRHLVIVGHHLGSIHTIDRREKKKKTWRQMFF